MTLTPDPQAFTSQVLEVQACATTPCYLGILKPVLSLLLKVKSVLKEPVSIEVSPVSLAWFVQDPGSIPNVEEKVTKLKLHRICTHVACLNSYK